MPRARTGSGPGPRLFRTLEREALSVRASPTGEVGEVYRGSAIKLVWVRKEREVIDPEWFVSPEVDLLIVVQGRLKVEFATPRTSSRVMRPGDVLVLPPRARCRAYRWPRSARRATVFVAVYPQVRRPRNPG